MGLTINQRFTKFPGRKPRSFRSRMNARPIGKDQTFIYHLGRNASTYKPCRCPARPLAWVEVIGDNHLIPHSDDAFWGYDPQFVL